MDCDNVALNFYFSKVLPIEQLNIIQHKTVITDCGELTVAIIGSSHFLKFEHSFFEILTCQNLKIEKKDLIFVMPEISEFSYKHFNPKYDYAIDLELHKYDNEKFQSEEKRIAEKDALLTHAFEKESAYTIIEKPIIENNTMSIVTWHTYPEYNIIFRTQNLYIPKIIVNKHIPDFIPSLN